MHFLSKYASEKYRWVSLVFLSMGLAIVIIDNTVLNVAIPYILRDLHTSFDAMQWVISGYALIIATILITIGRTADMIGRKKIFIIGCSLFAVGSFTASVSQNIQTLFFGEAFIEAIGASMMLTSSLSLLATEFQGRERALAFGIWGSVAGASATIGPLLGGYLTATYSWRWSLRINVFVAVVAVLGSIFTQESKAEKGKKFDILGTLFSGLGLFSLIFGFIEGEKYGWWYPSEQFSFSGFSWPFSSISIIPFAFLCAGVFLSLFIINEYAIEKRGGNPLMKLSLFKSAGFSLGLLTLGIVMLGQFGAFFILPIYLQDVLSLNAFQTGIIFLPTSLAILVVGPLSGIIASRIGPKWVISCGMFVGVVGVWLLLSSLTVHATIWSLSPSLAVFGIGIGMTSAQLTNLILSSVPVQFAGEASAVNSTIRQIGTSIGIAIIGVVLSGSLTSHIHSMIVSDKTVPPLLKTPILHQIQGMSIESGQKLAILPGMEIRVAEAIAVDIKEALVEAAKQSIAIGLFFIFLGAVVSLFTPSDSLFEKQNKEKY